MGTRKRDGFYKRDGSPYWWTRDPVTGNRCSTGFKDKEAARRWRAARERMAADPAHAAAEAATLGEWCGRFVAWKGSTRSEATAAVARQKLGHWIRLFGSDAPIARLSEPSVFDRYVETRRGEGASDHTISKEVAHMLAVLKLAKRAKCFSGDLSTLRPPDLHAGYKPRKRALNRQELARLLAALEPRRGALVAVCVALGCRLGEAFRLLPTDIEADRVFIRGTKTDEAERWVPILSVFRPLLQEASGYLPLQKWEKVWRDLRAACARAGIEPCSTNDLRRTHATILAEAGVDRDVTRRLLGHTTPTLVDRVYGQPTTEALAGLAEARLLTAAPILGENHVPVGRGQEEALEDDVENSGTKRRRRLRTAERGPSSRQDRVGKGRPGQNQGAADRQPPPVAADHDPGRNPENRGEDAPGFPGLADPRRVVFADPGIAADARVVQTVPAHETILGGPDSSQSASDVGVFEGNCGINLGAPDATRTHGLRFRKPSPALEQDIGILGFRGDARRWIPSDEPGFGRERQGSKTSTSQSVEVSS